MSVGRTHLNTGHKSGCSLKNKKLGCKLKLNNAFGYKQENNIEQVFVCNALCGRKTTVTLCLREPGVKIFQGTGELTCCLENQMCLLATEDKSECVSHLDLAGDEV